MYGYGLDENEREATDLLHRRLDGSRAGRRWERILRTHAYELSALMAVHPDLREHVGEAVQMLAQADTEHLALDWEVLAPVLHVLDDLQRLGSFEMQAEVAGIREELAMARGRRLADVLA